jgi:hypothetical protein
VPEEKLDCIVRYTVVVADSDRRCMPTWIAFVPDAVQPLRFICVNEVEAVLCVALVVLMLPAITVIVPVGAICKDPHTFQSPAVREIDVAFATTPFVSATPVAEFETYSPTLPAAALLFVVVPMMPEVVLNVKLVPVTAPENVPPAVGM